MAKPSKPQVPAVRKGFEITTGDVPDYINTGSQRGSEQVGMEDIVIPRLELVQSSSPCLKRNDPKYVQGAQIGQLINSVTRELYGDSVLVVPVYYVKQWLVWRDQKQGGGFAGAFDTSAEAQARAEQEGGADAGWEPIDTPQHMCLLLNVNTGKPEEIMVSMPRTKAKTSRAWNSMIRLAEGDRFSRVYKITTAEETSKAGQQYQNFVVTQAGYPPKWVYEAAETLYKRIASGQRRVVMDVEGMGEEIHAGGNSDM